MRSRIRKRVMRCAYCGAEKAWSDDFVNNTEATCLACWLRHHPEKVEPFRRALAEVDRASEGAG